MQHGNTSMEEQILSPSDKRDHYVNGHIGRHSARHRKSLKPCRGTTRMASQSYAEPNLRTTCSRRRLTSTSKTSLSRHRPSDAEFSSTCPLHIWRRLPAEDNTGSTKRGRSQRR